MRLEVRAASVRAHSAATSVVDRPEAFRLAAAPVWAAACGAAVSVVAGMPVAEVTAVAGIVESEALYFPGSL